MVDELISAGETTRRRAALDLVAGAAVERCRVVARRAVVLPVAIVCAVAGGVALAVTGARPGADATRPYYDTHPIGVLLLFAELGWLVMELAEGWRGRRSRRSPDRDARKQRRRFWLAVGACVVAVTATANLAPATEAAEIAPLVDRAYAFAADVYPDLLRRPVNRFPAWLPFFSNNQAQYAFLPRGSRGQDFRLGIFVNPLPSAPTTTGVQ